MAEPFLKRLTDADTGLVYTYANEARYNEKYGQSFLLEQINDVNLALAKEICTWKSENRIVEATLSLVSGQGDYLWPPNMFRFLRLFQLSASGRPYNEFRRRNHGADARTGIIPFDNDRGFRLVPTPQRSGDWTLRYQASAVPFLHYGTAASVTASTVVFAAAPTLGELMEEDDFYNGENVRIVSANSGARQVRRITDYDAATRTATITPDFSPTPTGPVVYEIAPAMTDDNFLHVVAMEVANQILMVETELDSASALYAMMNRKKRILRYGSKLRL